MPQRLVCIVALLLCSACSTSDEDVGPVIDSSPLGGDRPVEVLLPDGFDPEAPSPLLLMLHGYGASGIANDIVLKLKDKVNERGAIYLRPDGTRDAEGRHFWNATDGCCNFDGRDVDDVAYLQGLIDEAKGRYNIDHVAFIGHSNGGFMSHRFACDRAESVDAFASLAGVTWLDPTMCQPSEPVRALQMHGTADTTVAYDGGAILGELPPHPGALETVQRWAGLNGCSDTPDSAPDRDYTADSPGAETKVTQHPGCAEGGAAEFWSHEGEGHLPGFNDTWRDDVLDFLLER